MIARSTARGQGPTSWQRALADAVRTPAELLTLLGLPPEDGPGVRAGLAQFPLRVPRGFMRRMRPGDRHDPLLLQVLPVAEEGRAVPGFGFDPVGDLGAVAAPGVLHKYRGRVLLVATGACAVHCRYCFRRAFPYQEANARAANWRGALDYIAGDDTIEEVILSGGDPLMLADRSLHEFTDALRGIRHVRRLRLHTRLPIVLPERVDEGLLAWLEALPWQTVVVVHCNHARELDGEVAAGFGALRTAGATLLNQAVLLRGVNDDAGALRDLSEGLFAQGVLPYYLHLLDRVAGAAHFEVEEARAQALMHELRAALPGYLVPRLVREVAGEEYKRPLI
ncbi:EF-P beta-lysylation protein EpmB [Ectothiorhodospiraceae bacterium 2226]|nr:EF-P beta-lysylation protein EpmB [Ectothiorhodospiraceae bacterium 2226]